MKTAARHFQDNFQASAWMIAPNFERPGCKAVTTLQNELLQSLLGPFVLDLTPKDCIVAHLPSMGLKPANGQASPATASIHKPQYTQPCSLDLRWWSIRLFVWSLRWLLMRMQIVTHHLHTRQCMPIHIFITSRSVEWHWLVFDSFTINLN